MSEEFVVNDRRLFSKDGQINTEAETREPEAPAPPAGGAAETRAPEPPAGAFGLPAPTFPSLLVGLATSVLLHLGENPEPGSAPPEINLPAAKHAIDLLGVLKAKTRGNLESEEEALLETLLYDLRLKYVKASQ